MTTTKTYTGAWQVSDIINGHLVTRTYFGYTERGAVKLFRQWIKEGK